MSSSSHSDGVHLPVLPVLAGATSNPVWPIYGHRMLNRVAIVTGAASGIGKGIAMKFALEGANVAVCDLNMTTASATAAEIQGEIDKIGGRTQKIIAIKMDVTSESEVDDGVKQVVEQLGPLDCMVINAGIQHIEAIHELSYANWRKIVSIHLDAAFLCTRAALREMYKEDRGGCILYMGSVHSKGASVLKAPYVSAKHGMLGLARTVAKEGAPHNVRTNVICPGFVLSPLVEKQIPEQAKALGIPEQEVVKNMLKDTVDGKFTDVNDLVEVATLMASFPTMALTGQSFIVSHGWFME